MRHRLHWIQRIVSKWAMIRAPQSRATAFWNFAIASLTPCVMLSLTHSDGRRRNADGARPRHHRAQRRR